MKRISNKLMIYGIAIFLAGVVLQVFSMDIMQFFFAKMEPEDVYTANALRMLSTIFSTSVIPLGTTFIAASVVVRMLGRHLQVDDHQTATDTSVAGGTEEVEEADVTATAGDDDSVETFTDDFYRR